MKNAIEVRDLAKRFGALTAVDNISFTVSKGEIFGFLGPNGAGKTTTVRMLTGVIDPTSGTAGIHGHDIQKEPVASRANIAVVPEEANVYLDLSVRHNVLLMAELYAVERKRRLDRTDRLLEQFGLSGREKQKARELSKGLRQRLMLCAALVTDPDILFLDEPTSGLDVKSAKLIREIVSGLNSRGLTVFMTTHNMAEAEQMCSRVAIIDKGRIAAIDRPEKLGSAIKARQYVEVRFPKVAPEGFDAGSLPEVSQVERRNRTYRQYTDEPGKTAAGVVRVSDGIGLEVEHLNICKPSLDEVFLYFTREKEEGGE